MTERGSAVDPFAEDDGAYLLGALPPERRAAFEAHLRECASCSESVAQLAALPGLLGRVPADVATALDDDPRGSVGDLPGTVLDAVLDRVAQEQRQRRRRAALLVAAAAAALVVAVAAIGGLLRDSTSPGAPPGAQVVALERVAGGSLSVTASLAPVDWGTRIELLCSYDAGPDRYATPPEYVLVLHAGDGSSEQAATWRAVPGRDVTVAAATALPADDITGLEVRTVDGHVVLHADR